MKLPAPVAPGNTNALENDPRAFGVSNQSPMITPDMIADSAPLADFPAVRPESESTLPKLPTVWSKRYPRH